MVQTAFVLAASVKATCRATRPIDFHLLHAPSRFNLKRFARRLEAPHFRVVLHEITSDYADLPVAPPYSKAIFFRLDLPNVLADVGSVLYLDADTLVCRDLQELYDLPLDGRAGAAVPDYNLFHFELHAPIPIKNRFGPALLYLKEELDIVYSGPASYFNSGVMLLDLAAWRRMGLTEACRAFIRGRRLQWPDQDAINVILGGDYIVLDPRWNAFAMSLDRRPASPNPALDALQACWRDDPWIIHYSGSGKPWQFARKPPPHADRYWRMAALSPTGRALKAGYWKQMLFSRLARLTKRRRVPQLP